MPTLTRVKQNISKKIPQTMQGTGTRERETQSKGGKSKKNVNTGELSCLRIPPLGAIGATREGKPREHKIVW